MERGDADAQTELYDRLYDELHGIAHRLMARERGNHTLQTTALVNEAWLRLAGGGAPLRPEDQGHFVRLAARAMRRVLVDHARRRQAGKRQGQRAQPLIEETLSHLDDQQTDLIALDEALTRLGARDETAQRVVELRFFSGLTLSEVGAVLGKTERQAGLTWAFARGWLKRELARGEPRA